MPSNKPDVRLHLEAFVLRSEGLTFEAIGDRLGVSRQRAYTLVGKGARLLARMLDAYSKRRYKGNSP